MARTKRAAPPTEVSITYDLFALPTAQHKAGLAGLLLQMESMQARRLPEGCIPQRVSLTPTSAEIRFTADSITGLFDDLYAARTTEVFVRSKWKKPDPKRESLVWGKDEHGNRKKEKRFVYDVVQPRGYFLRQHLPDGEDGLWHKLWRDMLWTIPRGIPMTRLPFEQRAEGEPCKEGQSAWGDLVKAVRVQQNGCFHTTEVSSALWLGAQAANAEAISFQGRAEQNLLLHFWMLTCLVFVPERIEADGSRTFVGYVLAIPEVADLVRFKREYPRMLHQLSTARRGYRPAEAVITLPEQGALSFLEHLARLSPGPTDEKFGNAVAAVEYLHLAKMGNSIKMLANGRVRLAPEKLESYRMLLGADRPAPYANPLFLLGLLQALLNDQQWYEPFARMLAELPDFLFLRTDNPPKNVSWFWLDAAHKLAAELRNSLLFEEAIKAMSPDSTIPTLDLPRRLPLVVYRVVRTYLYNRAAAATGVDLDHYRSADGALDWKRLPREFGAKRASLARGLFLEFRSRRETALEEHFANTFLDPEAKVRLKKQDLLDISTAFLDPKLCEHVKTLILMALSASS